MKTKTQSDGFYDPKLRAEIDRFAERHGLELQDAVTQLMIDGLMRMGIELPPDVKALYKGPFK